MHYIVLDLEWNQPMTFRGGGYRAAQGKLLFEMLQIGAVRLNDRLEVYDSFNQLIQPSCYFRIHPHIKRITHISEYDIADAPLFTEAYTSFCHWCGEDSVLLTWGCDDISVFEQNIHYFGCEQPLPRVYDAQQYFSLLIDSPKVATFDMKPEMSAPEVTKKALELIDSGKYDVMILNYANCDMVGHTGVIPAAVEAVKEIDKDVGILVDEILKMGGRAFVTADHGNADQMIDPETGEPFTAHTTNPVPFIACDERLIGRTLRSGGRLADIAPTMLECMGVEIPKEMTGKSLIE